MNCASKRIRRNSNYYIGGGNQYFWCTTCYNELNGNIPIEVGDLSMQKAELVKKKNDEVHEESWVQCNTCERWIHQICGLFNSRQNKEHQSAYSCPACLLEKRKKQKKKKEDQVPACSLPGAEALPRTKLSEVLETHVRAKVDEKIKSLAEEKAKTDVSRSALALPPVLPIDTTACSPFLFPKFNDRFLRPLRSLSSSTNSRIFHSRRP